MPRFYYKHFEILKVLRVFILMEYRFEDIFKLNMYTIDETYFLRQLHI